MGAWLSAWLPVPVPHTKDMVPPVPALLAHGQPRAVAPRQGTVFPGCLSISALCPGTSPALGAGAGESSARGAAALCVSLKCLTKQAETVTQPTTPGPFSSESFL